MCFCGPEMKNKEMPLDSDLYCFIWPNTGHFLYICFNRTFKPISDGILDVLLFVLAQNILCVVHISNLSSKLCFICSGFNPQPGRWLFFPSIKSQVWFLDPISILINALCSSDTWLYSYWVNYHEYIATIRLVIFETSGPVW